MTGFEVTAVRQDWNRPTSRDWADVLAQFPLFSQVGKRRLREIARAGEFALYVPGDTVIAVGEPADWFFVILSGEATVRGRLTARTLSTGDFFGEMALLDGTCRSASVVATDELHVLKLSRRTFFQLLERDPGVAQTILSELGARVRRLEQPVPLAL